MHQTKVSATDYSKGLSKSQRNFEKFQKQKELYETKECTFKP